MKKERVRTRGFNGFGRFILGWFVGFVSTLLLIVGIGYWAYTSINIRKIEKWTKSDIISNKDLEKITLQDAVAIALGVAKGSKDYTLAKMEEDFGVKILGDTLYGISLDKLKNAPIKELGSAFSDTINSATFNSILSFMNVDESELGLLNTVLDSKVTYYVNEGKLYTGDAFSVEVSFDYTIEGDIVKFSNGTHTIASGKITPRLSDLPLNTAMNKIQDVTGGLKIYEILDYHYDVVTDAYYQNYTNGTYSNPVSGVMGAIAGFSIDDLEDQSKINGLQISKVMGYYYNAADKCYYTTSNFVPNSKVAGVMNSLADKTLGDLSNAETFNNLYIWQVMGYTQKEVAGTPTTYEYWNDGVKVAGIMATLADKTVGGLDDEGAFDDILLADALGYTISGGEVYNGATKVTGVVKHLVLMNSSISTISNDVKTLTIQQILDVNPADSNTSSVIKALCDKNSTIDTLNNDIKTLTLIEILGGNPSNNPIIEALKTSNISSLSTDINSLTLGEALGKTEATSTGILKALCGTKITELDDAIAGLQIYQVMGYSQVKVSDSPLTYKYTNANGDVTGIMGAIAGSKVNELSDTINSLRAVDIFDKGSTTVLKLFSDAELSTNYNGTGKGLTIMDLPNAVSTKINSVSIGYLVENGIITGVDQESVYYNSIKDKTLAGLLNTGA